MKIVYVISFIERRLGFEEYFLELKNRNIDFQVILINRNKSDLYECLKFHGIFVEEYIYTSKKSLPKTIFKLRNHFKAYKPTHLHAHLLEAGFIAGIAGWLGRVKNRIYTRHHGDMHYIENKHGRIYDRIIHSFYSKIVCVSRSHFDYLIETENIKRKKLFIVPNFVDPSIFDLNESNLGQIREKYLFKKENINIGINARWVEFKGLQYVLPALLEVVEKHPLVHFYLFNAKGNDKEMILKLLEKFNSESYTVVEFESEIMSVYPNFDIFIHCPVRPEAESYGLVYVEAMGSGVPCVFTLSGIAKDIVIDEFNALVVGFKSEEEISNAICRLIESEELRNKLAANAKSVKSTFTLVSHVDRMFEVYNK